MLAHSPGDGWNDVDADDLLVDDDDSSKLVVVDHSAVVDVVAIKAIIKVALTPESSSLPVSIQ